MPIRKTKSETVDLVAVNRGFYAGRMVERGERFTFTGTRRPKWAQLASLPVPAEKPFNGDTRPLDAQKASKGYRPPHQSFSTR